MANCPSCNSSQVQVTESHVTFSSQARRIRRRCQKCRHNWTMYEITAETLDKYKVLKDKFERLRNLFFAEGNVFDCHNCTQWANDCCSLDIPEAGGSFASDCAYYYKA